MHSKLIHTSFFSLSLPLCGSLSLSQKKDFKKKFWDRGRADVWHKSCTKTINKPYISHEPLHTSQPWGQNINFCLIRSHVSQMSEITFFEQMRGTYPPKTYLITHPWGYPQLFALPMVGPVIGHKHGQYRDSKSYSGKSWVNIPQT